MANPPSRRTLFFAGIPFNMRNLKCEKGALLPASWQSVSLVRHLRSQHGEHAVVAVPEGSEAEAKMRAAAARRAAESEGVRVEAVCPACTTNPNALYRSRNRVVGFWDEAHGGWFSVVSPDNACPHVDDPEMVGSVKLALTEALRALRNQQRAGAQAAEQVSQ